MEINAYNILQYFIIYSFIGWILESIVRSIIERKIINTGFLYGPFCPIYGVGACIMIICLHFFAPNILTLFIASAVILTVWEYFVGVLLEKIFKTKYWDYSHKKIQYKGRICLTNSIAWGGLGVVFIKIIHPFVLSMLKKGDPIIIENIVVIIIVLIIIDTIVSIMKIKNIKIAVEKIDKINIKIKEKIKALSFKEKAYIKSKKLEEKQALIESEKSILKLRIRQKRMLIDLENRVNKAKRLFPDIDTKEIREAIKKKTDMNKLTGKIEHLKANIKNRKKKE